MSLIQVPHGSTFGGNPLGCAVAAASLKVIRDEKLAERSDELGSYFLHKLKGIHNPQAFIGIFAGRGLFIGLELSVSARPYCEKLMETGLLCKETHDNIIRFAPPLVITKEELDWAYERIDFVLGIGS